MLKRTGLAFDPETAVPMHWFKQVVPRRDEFFQIDGCADTDFSYRKAVDLAVSLSCLPDLIGAETFTFRSRREPESKPKLWDLQRKEKELHRNSNHAVKVVSDIADTYKHGILAGGSRIAFDLYNNATSPNDWRGEKLGLALTYEDENGTKEYLHCRDIFESVDAYWGEILLEGYEIDDDYNPPDYLLWKSGYTNRELRDFLLNEIRFGENREPTAEEVKRLTSEKFNPTAEELKRMFAKIEADRPRK